MQKERVLESPWIYYLFFSVFFHQHFTETSAGEEAIMIIPETLAVASAMNLDNENPFEVDSDIEDGDASFLELERTETHHYAVLLPSDIGLSTLQLPPHIGGSFSSRTINSLHPSMPVSSLCCIYLVSKHLLLFLMLNSSSIPYIEQPPTGSSQTIAESRQP